MISKTFFRYFNGKEVAFFRIPLLLFEVGWAAVSSNNLAIYTKDLKATLFLISALELLALSLE